LATEAAEYNKYSSAMTEKPRELGDFKEVGHFEAKFRLKGYVLRQYLWTVK